MNFATLLRYADLNNGTDWNHKYCIPQFWDTMARKYDVGLFAVMGEKSAEECVKFCDGLFLPGNNNHIDSKYWGAEPLSPSPVVDDFPLEAKLIKLFIEAKKPIFGICGGHQAINVTLGGSLKRVAGHYSKEKERHLINIKENSFVYDVFKSTQAEINTYHHWAVDKLAPGLSVVAESDEGVIEAFECKEKNIFATQWHPERSFGGENAIETRFFENFIECCRGTAK